MELNALSLKDGATLQADLCIVGAGPAGIALARALAGLDLDVLVLESGGLRPEDAVQALDDGTTVGEPSLDLGQSRYRGAGGAARLWNTPVGGGPGAKFVPLDPYDFEMRPDRELSGWPFDRSHLEPYYRKAQAFAGLGPFAYDGKDWSNEGRPGFLPSDDRLVTRVYQFGNTRAVLDENLRLVLEAGNVRLCHHATVCTLEADSSGHRIVGAEARTLHGDRLRVHAGVFVLAAGALENARLLLLSANGRRAPGNQHGWVGRCFMEHPRDYALTLLPASTDLFERLAFFDAHHAPDGTVVGGRFGLNESVLRAERLPNASVTLLPRVARTRPAGIVRRLMARLSGEEADATAGGYGWSRLEEPWRAFDAFRLIVNLEQFPNPENRVTLSSRRDPLELPRLEVRWGWRAEEQARLDQLRMVLASALESSGLGRVEIDHGSPPDPNAHHHAGTTRMHADPRWGVVDPDCRVHGTDNLYVTGASVFPTAGFANPTLTIFAMALRLADHLKARGR